MSNTIVCTSDWHITASTPISRLPGYQDQQFDKINWILSFCQKSESALYVAGDIFDKAREPRSLLNKYISLFRQYGDVKIYACAGQHDQLWHSADLSDTNLQVLFTSGLFSHFGIDWGGEYTDVSAEQNILLTHFCVTDKPNKFISYSVTAKKYMSMVDNRVIITGDYHVPHYLHENGRVLLNPGSIMRDASDTLNKIPSVYLLHTDSLEIETVEIPIQPIEDVFNLNTIHQKHAVTQQTDSVAIDINNYIKTLKEQDQVKPDFKQCLARVIQKVAPNDGVKTEIVHIMNQIN